MRSNNTGRAGAVDHFHGDPALWPAFDELPPAIQREIAFALCTYDAVDMLQQYREARRDIGGLKAADWLCRSIQGNDEQDLRSLGRRYQARYGLPYPGLASGVPILRYRVPLRRRPTRPHRGMAPSVRAAWLASERLMPAA